MAFMGFIPVPVFMFAWLAMELERYMNTFGSFRLIAAMMILGLALFTVLQKIRSLLLLAAITFGQYVILYFMFYRKL